MVFMFLIQKMFFQAVSNAMVRKQSFPGLFRRCRKWIWQPSLEYHDTKFGSFDQIFTFLIVIQFLVFFQLPKNTKCLIFIKIAIVAILSSTFQWILLIACVCCLQHPILLPTFQFVLGCESLCNRNSTCNFEAVGTFESMHDGHTRAENGVCNVKSSLPAGTCTTRCSPETCSGCKTSATCPSDTCVWTPQEPVCSLFNRGTDAQKAVAMCSDGPDRESLPNSAVPKRDGHPCSWFLSCTGVPNHENLVKWFCDNWKQTKYIFQFLLYGIIVYENVKK